jgi:transcriptional regulator with XRE-family HTH domain
MTDIRQILALNMKHNRQLQGLSQSKLAEKIDTATNYISKIESEKQFPSVQMLEKIAGALNIDVIGLFSTKLARNGDSRETAPVIVDGIAETMFERLVLIEQDLYENTKRVRELRELLQKADRI